jgi:hypothetical protein
MKVSTILMLSSFGLFSLPKVLNFRPSPVGWNPPAQSPVARMARPRPTVEVIHGTRRTVNIVSAASGSEPKQ